MYSNDVVKDKRVNEWMEAERRCFAVLSYKPTRANQREKKDLQKWLTKVSVCPS
jgi:hypothetical protein